MRGPSSSTRIPRGKAATYIETVKTVDPVKATGWPHTLWLAFAKMYEDRGLLGSAREVFQRATQVNFKAADHLAAVWCEWTEMELRHHNSEGAIDLVRQATSEPSIEVRRRTSELYQAIQSGLPDKDARAMCIGFVDLEIGLREVDRARALHISPLTFGSDGTTLRFFTATRLHSGRCSA